ncbi:hypothetical protein O6H91_13G059900 [Diphasiastrum complanatum]|uniref:Uncharacterized protein n=1 Tax=Diphasiastrum complanatum TaxID=34168 RepID=A0ACC2BVQ9_DIPCM|nr:hypothetical protein O6H91_13G059900 [Diphasiastrum complanatum]
MNKSGNAMVRTYLKIDNISSPTCGHERLKCYRGKHAASELARRFALQRAQIRARSSRPGTSEAHQSLVDRACKSIDTLFVLAKHSQQTRGYNSHLVAISKDDGLPRADKDIDQATICLLQRNFKKWDQEPSSMCSYGSDYDPSKSPGFCTEATSKTKSQLLFESLLKTNVEVDIENRFQSAVTDPYQSCPLMTLFSLTRSDSSYQKNLSFCPPAVLLEDRPTLHDISNLNGSDRQNPCAEMKLQNLRSRNVSLEKRTESARRKKKERNTTSMSACIPPDIAGVVAESTAIVKITRCPYNEFRESMTQMIELINHSDLLDLEELLYCYFALNSPEHYEVIVEAFKAAWHEFI